MTAYLDWQNDEVVVTGRYFLEYEALDDWNSLAEQSPVRERRGRSELLGRDVVYADDAWVAAVKVAIARTAQASMPFIRIYFS
jgi:hypothetical protein